MVINCFSISGNILLVLKRAIFLRWFSKHKFILINKKVNVELPLLIYRAAKAVGDVSDDNASLTADPGVESSSGPGPIL